VILLIAAVLATLITAAYGRYRLSQVHRDWESVLSPEARGELNGVRVRMIVDATMADDALLGAETARTIGDWGEACRLLDLGVWALDQATPSRLERLRGMGAAIRMAAAIAPPPPLHPRLFGTREVRSAAVAGLALHHLLVTPAERMLLRLWMISCAFRLALRVARRSAAALRLKPQAAHHWSRYIDGSADWQAADEEHLASFRLLLESAAAADRAESLAR
jgi:hypothetical protein